MYGVHTLYSVLRAAAVFLLAGFRLCTRDTGVIRNTEWPNDAIELISILLEESNLA
jgi:hypothetical protein